VSGDDGAGQGETGLGEGVSDLAVSALFARPGWGLWVHAIILHHQILRY
jgi:hypothetical protein